MADRALLPKPRFVDLGGLEAIAGARAAARRNFEHPHNLDPNKQVAQANLTKMNQGRVDPRKF